MRQKPKVARQVKEEFDFFLFITRWARWLLQIAIAAFVISAGYLLYAIFSGALNQAAAAAQAERLARNLTTMGQIMTLACLVGSLCFVVMTIGEIAFAVALGLLGAALMFGLPVLVAGNVRVEDFAGIINLWAKNAGMAIFIVVGLRILYEIEEQLRTAGVRRKEKEEAEEVAGLQKAKKPPKPGIWSPCWKLPYCHEAVREQCPAYKSRKSCWRYGSGCNCDPGLIERLIRSGALEAGKGASRASAKERTTHAAYVRSDLAADVPLKAVERTIPCSKCPIYLDHQRQKFKIVNPIAVVATLLVLAAAYLPLRALYYQVVTTISNIASRFTLGTNVDPGKWFEYLNTPALQIFFFIIVGLLALAYVLKFVEWAIFEKKL